MDLIHLSVPKWHKESQNCYNRDYFLTVSSHVYGLDQTRACYFSGKHTGQLKDEVTSPGGTTIRGIQV